MYHSLAECYECHNIIEKKRTIYKACDSTFCSDDCRQIRYALILNVDPQLRTPYMWKFINEMGIVQDTIQSPIKKTKSSISINIDSEFEHAFNSKTTINSEPESESKPKPESEPKHNPGSITVNKKLMSIIGAGISMCGIYGIYISP